MEINFNDETLLDFLHEILENKYLHDVFSGSRYWKKGGEQAIKFICNSSFDKMPDEVATALRNLLEDVCPEKCEACGHTIPWHQMTAAIINEDGLCEYHHNSKTKREEE